MRSGVIAQKMGMTRLFTEAGEHVPVTVLSHGQAVSEAKKKPVHHKIRYIAGGIVLGLIVLAGAALLIKRWRMQAD